MSSEELRAEGALPSIYKDGNVFVVNLGNCENRFNIDWLDAFEAKIDEAENSEGPAALVTTATGKIWSNGLDLDWVSNNPSRMPELVQRMHGLYVKLLSSQLPTVAAVTGHAFGGGAMLSAAHDQIIMRSDRGYWCLPEINMGISFPPGLAALLVAKIPQPAINLAMLGGHRFGGQEAVEAGIANEALPEHEVLKAAIERAEMLSATRSEALPETRRQMYPEVIPKLSETYPAK